MRNLRLHKILLLLFIASTAVFHVTNTCAADIADREVLPNGMVLLHSEKKALPIVKVIVAIKSGSNVEPQDRAGLANITADLLHEGTVKRSAKKLSQEIEFVGGSLTSSGGQEYITVSLSILKKDVDLGFDLLSDVLMHPAFREDEIARRKAMIVSSIIQQKEEPGTVASKAFLRGLFGEAPYGRPLEGTEESVMNITRKDILDFYEAYYRPNNSIVAVVGDVSKTEIESLMKKYFGAWEKKDTRSHGAPPASLVSGKKIIKIDKDINQANIILGHNGITRENPDFYAVQVMNYILGSGGFASRLMDNIRDNRGLAYDVHSVFSASKYAGSFEVVLQTKNKSANSAIGEVLKEMERIGRDPVTDKELTDAKSYLTGSLPLKIDSDSKLAAFLIPVEFFGLGLNYVDDYRKFISSVSKADIMRVARKYLDTTDYILVIVGRLEQASLKY